MPPGKRRATPPPPSLDPQLPGVMDAREWPGPWRPEAFRAAEGAKAFDRKKRKRTGNYEEEM